MITYLRKNQQIFIVLVVAYCALLIFGSYIFLPKLFNVEEFFKGSVFFFFFDISLLAKTPPLIFTIFDFILILFIGFYLVRICINYLIIQSRSQFPALFVVALSSFAFQDKMFSMSTIGAIFVLIAFDRLIGSMEKQDINYRYIDGGLLISLGSLFYTNLLLFLPILWIAQAIIRKLNAREVLFTIVGFLIPYLYVLTGAYLFNYSVPEILKQIFFTIIERVHIIYTWQFLAGIGAYLAFLIVASIFAIMKFSTKKIQSRKLYQLFLYLFLIAVTVYFVIPSGNFDLFILVSIPASVLFSIYFTECNENLINSALLVILLLIPLALPVLKIVLA